MMKEAVTCERSSSMKRLTSLVLGVKFNPEEMRDSVEYARNSKATWRIVFRGKDIFSFYYSFIYHGKEPNIREKERK